MLGLTVKLSNLVDFSNVFQSALPQYSFLVQTSTYKLFKLKKVTHAPQDISLLYPIFTSSLDTAHKYLCSNLSLLILSSPPTATKKHNPSGPPLVSFLLHFNKRPCVGCFHQIHRISFFCIVYSCAKSAPLSRANSIPSSANREVRVRQTDSRFDGKFPIQSSLINFVSDVSTAHSGPPGSWRRE